MYMYMYMQIYMYMLGLSDSIDSCRVFTAVSTYLVGYGYKSNHKFDFKD